MNLRNYVCELVGCKVDCSTEEDALRACLERNHECEEKISDLSETVRQLRLLVPRNMPPKLQRIVEKDTVWVQAFLQSLGLNIIRLPLDARYRFPGSKQEAMKIITWDWTDRLRYVRDYFDCPDFAMHFAVMTNLYFRCQVAWVIDYRSAHSYNLIIIPDDDVFVLEPQSDALYFWTKRPEEFYHLKGAMVVI